jgi:hypothetical protein
MYRRQSCRLPSHDDQLWAATAEHNKRQKKLCQSVNSCYELICPGMLERFPQAQGFLVENELGLDLVCLGAVGLIRQTPRQRDGATLLITRIGAILPARGARVRASSLRDPSPGTPKPPES